MESNKKVLVVGSLNMDMLLEYGVTNIIVTLGAGMEHGDILVIGDSVIQYLTPDEAFEDQLREIFYN